MNKKGGGEVLDISKLLESIAKSLQRGKESSCEVRKTGLYEPQTIEKKENSEVELIPERIRQMKAIAEMEGPIWLPREKYFIKQARFMEDYEDDFSEYVPFQEFYPTYVIMNDRQLRFYFSWRTRIRKGEYTEADVSYIFVYIYELLALVGCSSAEEGFRKLWQLHNLVEENCEKKSTVLHYLNKWLFDFVVYYGLDPMLLSCIYDDSRDLALVLLSDKREHSADELFEALSTLSTYAVFKSRFFKEYPEDFKAVLAGTYEAMCSYCEKNCKTMYFERLFGKEIIEKYGMFEFAVFDLERRLKYEYKLNPVHSYVTTITGIWFSKRFDASSKKSKAVGTLLKTVDRIMREEYSFGHYLANDKTTKILESAVKEQIALLFEEKKKKERAEIRIDMSLLSDIRKSADITRERLIIDEEEEAEEPEITISAVAENDTEGLSAEESDYLRRLLCGEVYKGQTPVSLLCDSINEKLFERFSDTVIDFFGDSPQIIEDYREELEELYCRK